LSEFVNQKVRCVLPKLSLSNFNALPAEELERRLMNGAVLVYGELSSEALSEFVKMGQEVTVFTSSSAAELPSSDILMLWAILVFAHDMPGPHNHDVSESDLKEWKDRLFDRLVFVNDAEPMPEVALTAQQGTREVLLQFFWETNHPNWQGVRLSQVRRIALAIERRYLRAVGPPPSSHLPGPDWWQFEHPDGLFRIACPKRWVEVPAVSKGASLSCAANDSSILIEVMLFRSERERPPGENEIAGVIVDGLLAQQSRFKNSRVLLQGIVAQGLLGRCLSVILQHQENGQTMSTEYYVAGSGDDALFVSLKCLASRYFASRPDFTRVCASLYTPWLNKTGHG
jgi:hypothetical protein